MAIGLAGDDAPFVLEGRDDGLARGGDGEPGKALAGLGGHAAVLANHRDLIEFVANADLEVVGVVRRA